MILFRWTSVLFVGMTLGACDLSGIAGAPRAFEHAAVTRACGPADGPAVGIYLASDPVQLTDPPMPHVRIYLWDYGVQDLEGRMLSVGENSPNGAAWFHTSANNFEIAEAGVVRIDEVHADNSVEGSVNILFPGGRRVWSGFRATFIEPAFLCG
jgi:hypothetical protein